MNDELPGNKVYPMIMELSIDWLGEENMIETDAQSSTNS